MKKLGAVTVGILLAMVLVAGGPAAADPGDPGEPQVVVWVADFDLVVPGSPAQVITGQGYQHDDDPDEFYGEEVTLFINDIEIETVRSEMNAEGSYTPGYIPPDPIVPGDVIKLVGDVSGPRVLVVGTFPEVKNVNQGQDRVSGTAPSGSNLFATAVTKTGPVTPESVIADGNGNWVVDFARGDIGSGTYGLAAVKDDDGDLTAVGWRVPGNSWEDVAIEPGDETECEFEKGVFTVYQVDESTLPQFDRIKVEERTNKDGTTRTDIQFERSGIRMVKWVDGENANSNVLIETPDVLIESQRANITVVTSETGEIISYEGAMTIVELTEDKNLVDRNRQTLSGFDPEANDGEGKEIVVKETGVCRP